MRLLFTGIATISMISPVLSDAKIVYENRHGTWAVRCTQDYVTDAKVCAVVGRAAGSGVFGSTHLSILVESSDKTRRPMITVNVPLLYLQHGLTLRIDGGTPFDVTCTSITGDNCVIQGNSRDMLLSSLSGAEQLVIRAFGFPDVPHDFIIQLDGFRDAFDDFTAVTEKML
jgi:invasion protein IalB